MKTCLNFLVAAKRCEIAELQALGRTGALVNLTGRLVHGLQRERGLSNLYLGSAGARFAPERQAQISECQIIESELRGCFDNLDTESATVSNGARLFSRIAYALHGLDALEGLRAQVHQQVWEARKTTEAYVRLIAGLLKVVFEAADNATDPEISRLLVARFNFMQGKEWAGQERATGSALYASGRAENSEQQHMLHLIESQERCLQVFTDFSSKAQGALWHQNQIANTLAELERMRRVLCTTAHGASLDASQSPVWFECCSLRIDRMKLVEDQLAQDLLQVCADKIETALHDLHSFTVHSVSAVSASEALTFFKAPTHPSHSAGLTNSNGVASLQPQQGYGLNLERSILDLVQEQAKRLQNMGDELDTVRASLNERKLIERAKGLLMAHRQLTEEDAHKTMRQMAMNQNRRLIEVAQAVLAMADVLPERRR